MIKLIFICCLIFSFVSVNTTQAQFLKNLKKKTEEKVKREAEKRTQERINKGVEKAYDEAEDEIDGKNKKDETNTEVNNGQKAADTQNPNTGSRTTEQQASPQLLISSKYDFIPGEKVIFYDDFTSEAVGDFPIQWNTTGSGEVITQNLAEGRWFYISNGRGITTLDEAIVLPDNYTIEFDAIPYKNPKNNNSHNFSFWILSTTKPKDLNYGLARPGEAGICFSFEYYTKYFAYYNDGTPVLGGSDTEFKLSSEKKYRISIQVQKQRIKLYVDDQKIFDLPKAMHKNYKYNMIRFDNGTPLISNVRIATGVPDMRSKLLTEGKLISYGIFFDVNKDIVKPESYPSIKEIANILNENPTLKIKIVGHTDSDGDANTNKDLSMRRANSVKNILVKDFNIEESRIISEGKGALEPVAPNDNITNKALNRRVEFIKV